MDKEMVPKMDACLFVKLKNDVELIQSTDRVSRAKSAF